MLLLGNAASHANRARRHTDAALILPWLRVWLAICQPFFSLCTKPARDFRFPVQTDQRRRWRQARIQLPGRCSVSSALLRIAFQTGGRCAQSISARHLRNLFRRRISIF